MVWCCIVVPLALYIWDKFLQPIFLKFWNPWVKVEDKAGDEKEGEINPDIKKGPNEAGLSTEGKGKIE